MNAKGLTRDGLSALGLTIILMPQAIAYASLAGATPAQGVLAAAAAPLAFYVLRGGRTLSPGPVAIIALMSAEAAGRLATQLPPNAPVVPLIALGMGLILVTLSVLRAGFILAFVSEPVLMGFMSAAAVVIGVTQLPALMGIPVSSREISLVAQELLTRLDELSAADAIVGGSALCLLLGKARIAGLLPDHLRPTAILAIPLFVVAVAILLATLFPHFGLTSVGAVTVHGLTWPSAFEYWRNTPDVLAAAAGPAALAVLIARAIQSNSGVASDRVKPSDNLAGSLGMSNGLSGFLGGMPVGISVSRSTLGKELNIENALPHVLAGLLVLVIALVAGDVLQSLPQSVVAALIISALPSVFNFRRMAQIVRYNAFDATAMAITVFSVIGFGVQNGLIVGGASALVLYLYRTTRVRVLPIGPMDGGDRYEEADRRNVQPAPTDRVLTLRVGEDLYFANCEICEEKLNALVRDKEPSVVVLDMRAVGLLDSSAVLMLTRVRQTLGAMDVELRLSRLNRDIEKRLRVARFLTTITSDGRNAPSVDKAVRDGGGGQVASD